MPRAAVALAVVLCVVACESKRANEHKAPEQKASPAPALVDLPTADSLAAVRSAFNAHRGEPRFIALLSPT